MKKETAMKRIDKVVEREFRDESYDVRKYIKDLILLSWESLREDFADPHSDSDNLDSAIQINVYDERYDVLRESREQTKKYLKEKDYDIERN